MTDLQKHDDQRTIVVSDLPAGLTEDDLIIHFQSRKNGGGDVETVDLSEDGSQAFVSFEMANVVEDVLRVEQIIKGRLVKVHRKTEEKNDEKSSSNDVYTVVVSGFNENTTDETVSLFFEHKKKSGGGSIKEFQRFNPKEAFITFCSAKDAEDVLNKSSELCLDGHSLTVKPWKGPSSDKSMLIIENLNPNTTHDTLKNYIEMMADLDVINIVFGENNNAMASLSGNADGECIKKATERTLEDSNVRIKFAPPTFAVRIKMLPPLFSEDAILCKFENPRYGGGEASDRTFNKEKREAIIFFKDPAVVSRLVKKKHELGGVELSVTPYYEWFEELALHDGKKMAEHCGEVPISRDIVNFIETHHDIQKKFDLKSFNIDGNKEMLNFCKELVDSNEMENLKCKLKDFLDSFVKDSITGFKNISDKLKELMDERPEDFRDDSCCVLIFDEARDEIVLTGEKQVVAAKKESIMRMIDELREKSIIVKETIPVEDKNKLHFLNSIGYPGKMTTVFPGAEVIVGSSSGKIALVASRGIINDLRNQISRDVMGIATTNYQMSDRQIEFLKRTECKLVNEKFTKTGTSAQLSLVPAKAAASKEVYQAQLMLLKNSEQTEKLDDVVYKMISEKCLEVDSSTGRFLTKSAKWRDFQNQLFEKSHVMVEHKTTEPEKIWMVGEESIASEALEEARGYTTSSTITSSTVTIDGNRARYITSYLMKDISNLNERFPEEGVQVEHSNAGRFKITGTASGITKATEVLQSYSKEIASKFYEINGPGMKKQLQMDTTVAWITGIERENKCIIERNASAEDAIAEDANAEAIDPRETIVLPNGDDLEFVGDNEIRTKSGQKLSVVVGDLSKQKVDVIVNTTNDKLDLNANPCAKALLKVAGKELTEECQKKGDLKIGEVASTKPGDLDCKQVYHVFCGAWSDGKGEPILSKIVKDCLEKVQDDKLTSIAIPAIGTGNHKFPHATVANIFFKETLKFLADNPQTTVNDIRFVVYHKDQPSIDGFMNTVMAMKPSTSVIPPKDKIEEEARKDKAKPVPRVVVTKVGGFMNAVKTASFIRHKHRKDGKARINEVKPDPRAVPVSGNDFVVINDKEIRTTSGQKLSIVVGDLSNQKVDVIVNTTNDKLDLNANPCAKALLKVAGKELTEECQKKGDLKIGEVASTKPGDLDCKQVYHVSCGAWADGKGEPILSKIVKDCLKKVQDDKLTSIAIPAIGTGNHKFPHATVANIFFKETLKFLADNPQTTVNDIRFVVYHKDQPSIDGFMNTIMAMKPSTSVIPPKDKIEEEARKDKAKPVPRVLVTPDEKEKSSDHHHKVGVFQTNENADGHLDVFLGKNLTVQIVNGDITKESTEMIMHVTNSLLSLNGGVAKSLKATGGDVFEEECKAASPIPLFSVKFTGAGHLLVRQVAHVAAPDSPTSQDLEKCLEIFFNSTSKPKVQEISLSAIGAGAIGLSEKESAELILSTLCRVHQTGVSTLSLVRIIIFEKKKFENFKSAVKKTAFRHANPTVSTPATTARRLKHFPDPQICVRIYAQKMTTIENAWKELKEKLETQIQTTSAEVNVEKLSMIEVKKIEDIGKDYDVRVRVDQKAGRVEFIGHTTDVIAVQSKFFTIYNEIMELKKKGPPLPSHWDKQPTEGNNKEVSFHKVKLKSSSSEYKKVAKEFLKTAKTQTIVEIIRIQNPPMFRSYIARKDEKSGIDEKYFFHGTKAENVDAINREGFNRSFAGINGVAFGRGVYFARDASYSCQVQYAPLDAQNHQYIYYARVLVGEYTKGTLDMIVPPVKGDLNDPNAKFDCTVNDVNNPSIFVLFLDREHYPEYLIISKK